MNTHIELLKISFTTTYYIPVILERKVGFDPDSKQVSHAQAVASPQHKQTGPLSSEENSLGFIHEGAGAEQQNHTSDIVGELTRLYQASVVSMGRLLFLSGPVLLVCIVFMG